MAYKHFSVEERERLQLMRWERRSLRYMAKALDRSPSSVSRELRRNFPPEHKVYSPRIAHERALQKRKSRGRADRLKNELVRNYVRTHIKDGWSPEQIAGRLSVDCPGQVISHEAIYQYVYAQVYRNGCGYVRPGHEDLRPYLKRRHKRRGQKGMRTVKRVDRPKGSSINDRPAVVEKRIRIGDWEGDMIASKDNAPGLNSLVDRASGLVLLTKIRDKTAAATTGVITEKLSRIPHHTLTLDNGSENQNWQEIENAIGIRCFYANPYHFWERGTNENTNGLVRWYFPKRTDFRTIPNEAIQAVELALNTRPRKRLGWKTPLEVFTERVALGC